MLRYNKDNIQRAKQLRCEMTIWERNLWYGFLRQYPIRFQRQKAIGNYIADFYSAKAHLVIEVDGGEHYETEQAKYDKMRTSYLNNQGIDVLRFSNKDVDQKFYAVCEVIDRAVKSKLPPSDEGGGTAKP